MEPTLTFGRSHGSPIIKGIYPFYGTRPNNGPNMINKLLIPSTSNWNAQLLNNAFPLFLVSLVQNIHISLDPNPPKLKQYPNKNGKFSISSQYKILNQDKGKSTSSLTTPTNSITKKICNKFQQTRGNSGCEMFLWNVQLTSFPLGRDSGKSSRTFPNPVYYVNNLKPHNTYYQPTLILELSIST